MHAADVASIIQKTKELCSQSEQLILRSEQLCSRADVLLRQLPFNGCRVAERSTNNDGCLNNGSGVALTIPGANRMQPMHPRIS